jgi:hypothetical protein
VAETWSVKELLQAGWSEADLDWETTAERTAECAARGDRTLAKDEAGEAVRIARASFEPIDPRLGTALANFGLCLEQVGDGGGARLFGEALDVWRASCPWIARMDAPRMARSSLFHMRMELAHRETYRARWQIRWREMAEEAKARLANLGPPSPGDLGESAAETLARWRRERPALLNDTRKLMAAAFLLLAPSASCKDDDV